MLQTTGRISFSLGKSQLFFFLLFYFILILIIDDMQYISHKCIHNDSTFVYLKSDPNKSSNHLSPYMLSQYY